MPVLKCCRWENVILGPVAVIQHTHSPKTSEQKQMKQLPQKKRKKRKKSINDPVLFLFFTTLYWSYENIFSISSQLYCSFVVGCCLQSEIS